MSVLIETGDSLYGCVAVLHGHDLALCTRHHLENAVEAATGLSPSLQSFFLKNKKILMTSSLSKQGLRLGDRLCLHVAGKGGMPHADSPVLEEYYADSDAEKCGVVDSISECVFTDPVFSSLSGHTFSRSTLVQNNMKDPVFRENLSDAMVIPNRNKAGEVEQYLDRRLKSDISALEKSDLCDHDNCAELLSLVAMVARRSDLTACLNAKRLLTDLLALQSATVLRNVVAMASDERFRHLVTLAKAGKAETLEARLSAAQQLGSAAVDLLPLDSVAKRTESVSVKVNRVHPSVSKDLLQSVFRKYGTITSLNLIPGDGRGLTYAYVNYSTPAEAKRTCDKMNGVGLNGSKIQCLLKKPPGSSSSSSSPSSPMATSGVRVFPIKVSNLEEDVTEADLDEKFSEYGEIANIELKTTGSNHYAFINFYSRTAQRNASLHRRTTLRKQSVSVMVREERTISVESHPTKGLTPTSATPPSPMGTYMQPGAVVSADRKVKSTGRRSTAGPLPCSPARPPMAGPCMLPVGPGFPTQGHPGPGHRGLDYPGAGRPGPGHHPLGYPGAHHPGPSLPVSAFASRPPPAPVVVAISANACQAVVAMPAGLARQVERKIEPHTDFHKSQGTYTSYKQATGEFVVHGKDTQSVEFIAKEAYEAFCNVL